MAIDKILLIVPSEKLEAKFATRRKVIFPIDTAHACTQLHNAGFEICVIDYNTEDAPYEVLRQTLNDFNPDLLAVTPQMLTFNVREMKEDSLRSCGIAKEFNPEIITIVTEIGRAHV